MSHPLDPVAEPHDPANVSQFLHMPAGEGGSHGWHEQMAKVQLMLGEAEGRFVVRVPALVQLARGCNDNNARNAMSSMNLGRLTFPARWKTWGKKYIAPSPVDTCTVADAREVLAAAQHAKMDTLKDCVASDAVLDAIVAALVAQGKAICATKEEQFRTSIGLLQGSLERQSSPDEASLNETRELVMCLVHGLRFLDVSTFCLFACYMILSVYHMILSAYCSRTWNCRLIIKFAGCIDLHCSSRVKLPAVRWKLTVVCILSAKPRCLMMRQHSLPLKQRIGVHSSRSQRCSRSCRISSGVQSSCACRCMHSSKRLNIIACRCPVLGLMYECRFIWMCVAAAVHCVSCTNVVLFGCGVLLPCTVRKYLYWCAGALNCMLDVSSLGGIVT